MRDPITDLKRYARDLEAEVPAERARYRVARVIHSPVSGPRWSRRTVMAGATSVLMGLSNVALAAVANPSAPGDALYGVDRAYERILDLMGAPGDHHVERLDEATVLLERGRAVEALEAVREALQDVADADDVADARELLEELNAGKGNKDAEFQEAVRELVKAAKSVADHVDAAGISDAARGLDTANLSLAEAVAKLRRTVRPDHVNERDPGNGPPDGVTPGPPGDGPPGGGDPPGQVDKPAKPESPPTSASLSGGSGAPGPPAGVDPPGHDDQGDDEENDPGESDSPGNDEDTP